MLGNCCTTVLSPDGADTDTFAPGDVWCFPRGWGHSIRGIGASECHFILIFDDGAFAEAHTLSITDWLAHTSPAVVSQSLGLGIEWVAKLPKGEAYFAGGPFLMIPSRMLSPSRSRHLQRRIAIRWGPSNRGACRAAAHNGGLPRMSFRSRPRHPPPCWRFEPGAMRELHWHPHADEWQYYLEDAAEMAVYLGMGHTVIEKFVTGDIGYVPMGAGHYIRNTVAPSRACCSGSTRALSFPRPQRMASLESARCVG